MISKDQISILIVTHNHCDFIDDLLKSLSKFNYSNTYFCDALSTDGTLEKIMRSPFKKNLLSKTVLEGFSKNNNDLIRYFNLNSKYYLLLNPDTFFNMDFLKNLYNKMESNTNIGISTPILKYPNGNMQVTWKKFPSFFTVLKKRLGVMKTKEETQMKGPNIDWCLGACMLISDKLLKENQTLLDERYRLYCEDIDICFEAHSKNLDVVGVEDCFVFHNLNEKSSKNIFSKYNLWNISSIIKFVFKWNYKYVFIK